MGLRVWGITIFLAGAAGLIGGLAAGCNRGDASAAIRDRDVPDRQLPVPLVDTSHSAELEGRRVCQCHGQRRAGHGRGRPGKP